MRSPDPEVWERPFVSRLLLLAVTMAAMSALVAAVALPLVAGGGMAVKSAADTFEELPPNLLEPPLAQRTVVYDSSGAKLAVLHGAQDRIVVTLAQVPLGMQEALIGVEDSRFYEHHGIDFQGVARALVRDGQGGQTQGGSTLSQQYVKNVLEDSAHTPSERVAATAQTFQRKLREARYALELERTLSKHQILERYLNIAYFGDGAYGVGTAAEHYFGIRVESLNLAQSALLAGLVNSPAQFDPFKHPVAASVRRAIVLARMLALGYISRTEHDRATIVPLPRAGHVTPPVDACEGTEAPFFCDYVRTQLRDDPQLGADQETRDRVVYEGGLRVRTTLDMSVQRAAQAAVDAVLPRTDSHLAVVAVVQPGTGKVLAIAANRTYSSRRASGTTKLGYVGYTPLGFNPGSTFKMFTLVTALAQGLPLTTVFRSPACYQSKVFQNPTNRGGPCPVGYSNASDSEAGTFNLATATWSSVNTYYVQLEERVGLESVRHTALSMGIPAARLGAAGGSLTLGGLSDGVSPIELATAYATLAAHGVECQPRSLETVADSQGVRVQVTPAAPCHRVVKAAVADTATSVLEGVLTQPHATAQGRELSGRVAAGKTGTTDNETSAWFAGYTPQLSAAVGLGDPTAPSLPLGTVQGVNPVFGGTLPAEIWQQAMDGALQGVSPAAMPPAATDPGTVVAAPPGVVGGGYQGPAAPPARPAASPSVTATGAPAASPTPTPVHPRRPGPPPRRGASPVPRRAPTRPTAPTARPAPPPGRPRAP